MPTIVVKDQKLSTSNFKVELLSAQSYQTDTNAICLSSKTGLTESPIIAGEPHTDVDLSVVNKEKTNIKFDDNQTF